MQESAVTSTGSGWSMAARPVANDGMAGAILAPGKTPS